MKRLILLCALFVMCSSVAFAQEDKITQGVVTQTTNTTYTTVTRTKQVRMSDEEWAEYKRQKREERKAIRNGTADAATIQKYADEKKWGIGLRAGGLSIVNVVGNFKVTERSYAEMRLGLSWVDDCCVDFTALYNWRIINTECTPSVVGWFFDAGLGINGGGNDMKFYKTTYVGAALMARIGIKFYRAPITLSFDYTPSLGKYWSYLQWCDYTDQEFNYFGVINFGITCTYNF